MSIDQDLLEFIQAYVPSVWAIEQLALMRRDPDRGWTDHDLVRELRSSDTIVRSNNTAFERAGLIVEDAGRATFRPASPAIGDLVDRVLTLYRERPSTVTRAIVGRQSNLQQLADAFTFRPKSS